MAGGTGKGHSASHEGPFLKCHDKESVLHPIELRSHWKV